MNFKKTSAYLQRRVQLPRCTNLREGGRGSEDSSGDPALWFLHPGKRVCSCATAGVRLQGSVFELANLGQHVQFAARLQYFVRLIVIAALMVRELELQLVDPCHWMCLVLLLLPCRVKQSVDLTTFRVTLLRE